MNFNQQLEQILQKIYDHGAANGERGVLDDHIIPPKYLQAIDTLIREEIIGDSPPYLILDPDIGQHFGATAAELYERGRADERNHLRQLLEEGK